MPLLARLLLLILIAVLPALAILLYNERDLRNAREAETREEALRDADAVAAELERVVDGARDLLLTIAYAPSIRDANWPNCNRYLADLGDAYPAYSRLSIADRDGRIVCASASVMAGESMADRVYFREALAKGGFTVGTFTVSRHSGNAILPFAAPCRDRDGQIVGMVIGGLRLDWLARQVERKLLPPDGALLIADRDGTILTRSPDPDRWMGKIDAAWQPFLQAEKSGVTEMMGVNGLRQIYGYIPLRMATTGLFVAVGIGTVQPLKAILTASNRGLAMIAFAGLLALMTGWFFGNRFIRQPIRKLIAASYELGIGNYRGTTLPAGSGEFGTLSRAFEAMADTLASREAALRLALERNQALLREGHHRIKNNLQLISSLLGMQRNTLRDAGARLALQEARRRIQAIARVHEGFYRTGEFDHVDFGDSLRALCSSLVSGTKEQPSIVIDVPESCRIAAAQATPLALIANELITNALKHAFVAGQPGSIVVRCAIEPSGDVILTVADDGRGLPPTFEASTQRSFGMQLVRTLARQIGGEFHVQRRDPGTMAEIRIAPRPTRVNG
jgi:two-component sensor histidine kinase